MPGNYYIHNVFSGDVTHAFGEEKIKQQLAYQQQRLTELNSFLISRHSATVQTTENIVDKINIFEQQLPEIMRKLVSELPTINFNPVRQALAINDINMLQNAINQIKKDIAQYTAMYDEIASLGALELSKRPTWLTDDEMNKLTIQYSRMIKMRDQLDTILTNPENRWKIATYVSKNLGVTAGLVAEFATTNMLEKSLGPLGIHFAHQGTKGVSGGYTNPTEDISLLIEENSGKMTIGLPGISLKRTSTGKGKNPKFNIHLKSTSIGNLITFGHMVDIGFDLDTFYNAYANHKRKTINLKNGRTIINRVTGLRQMYKAFQLNALSTALTGSMMSGDYGYYLVINDQVFTAIDVIRSVLSGNANIVSGNTGISLKGINTLDQLLDKKSSGATTLQTAQSYIAKYHQDTFFDYFLNAEVEDETEAINRSATMISKIDSIILTLNLEMRASELI